MSASQTVYNVLTAGGLSPAAAEDVTGVLTSESGLKTGSQGNAATDASGVLSGGGGAFGIASWNGSRQTDLQNYANSVGGSPSDLNTQAGFVLQELQEPSYAKSWAALTDPNATQSSRITALVQNYENPASYNVSPEIARATAASNTVASTVANGDTSTTGSFAPGAATASTTGAATTAAGTASTVGPAASASTASTSSGGLLSGLSATASFLAFITSAQGVKRIVGMVGGLVLVFLAVSILAMRHAPAPVQAVIDAAGKVPV